MPESFDPYRKWLGIPPAEQPANHYRLLGIAVFEDDPDVIAYAADRQMSHVRKFQSGQNGAHAQKLLSELANARRCLLADAERKPYDAQLQKQLGVPTNGGAPVAPQPARTPPAPAPGATPPPPPPPPVDPPVATAQVSKAQPVAAATNSEPAVAVKSRPVSSVARRGRRKNAAVPLIATLLTLAGLAFVGLIVALAITTEQGDDPTADGAPQAPLPTTRVQQPNTQLPKPPGQNDPRPRPPKDALQPPTDRDPVMPEGGIGSGSEGGDQPDDAPVPAVTVDSPQRRAEFEQAATAAETALADRDMVTAAEQLASAKALRFSADEAERITHLETAHDRLTQFWTAVETGLKRLKPGDEVGFAGKISNFDSTQDESVTLLITGNRKTERLSDWEPFYLVAIAQRGLSSSDPVAKLVLATFLAVDQKTPSDEQANEARSLYDAAVAGGQSCEFLASRLGDSDDAQSLPKPGGSSDTQPETPGAPALPATFPDPDGTLPSPGDEAEVGPTADAA